MNSDFGIQIRLPRRFDIVGARLVIAGVGTAFEASYGWRLADRNDNDLATGYFQSGAMGTWMPIIHETDVGGFDYVGPARLQVWGDNPSDEGTPLDMDEVAVVAIPGADGFLPHQVQQGETLSQIAQQYSSTVERIAAASRLRNPDLILAGQVLRVPQP